MTGRRGCRMWLGVASILVLACHRSGTLESRVARRAKEKMMLNEGREYFSFAVLKAGGSVSCCCTGDFKGVES